MFKILNTVFLVVIVATCHCRTKPDFKIFEIEHFLFVIVAKRKIWNIWWNNDNEKYGNIIFLYICDLVVIVAFFCCHCSKNEN